MAQKITVNLHCGKQQWKLKLFKGTPVDDIFANIRQITNINDFICLDDNGDPIVLSSYLPDGIHLFIKKLNNNNNNNLNINCDINLNTNDNAILDDNNNDNNNNDNSTCSDDNKDNNNNDVNDVNALEIHIERGGIKQTKTYKMPHKTDFASLNVLRTELLDGCYSFNLFSASRIQGITIPLCLTKDKKENIYPHLLAKTHKGCGKTVTFVLIMLSRINENVTQLQGLCIVHSRELANHTYQVFKKLSIYIVSLRICLAIPNEIIPDPWDCQICIGTPGTLIDKVIHPTKRNLNIFLQSLKILVIDEADQFSNAKSKSKGRRNKGKNRYSMSLYQQLICIKDRINKFCKKKDITELQKAAIDTFGCIAHVIAESTYQSLLFSASDPPRVIQLGIAISSSSYRLSLKTKDFIQVKLGNIKIYKIKCDDDTDKFTTLIEVISLSNFGQVIIFVNTDQTAKHLLEALSINAGIACSVLYSKAMDTKQRDLTMNQFRKGQTTCLISTNLIKQGIDVPDVGLVVNFEIPINNVEKCDSDVFMYRIKRTGRFGSKGVCINLLSKNNIAESNKLDTIIKEYSLSITPIIKDAVAKFSFL